jgi:hypothetical protein
MPGPAISKYLSQHTDKGFNEVATVFRHDFVQFMGMVHSWTVMIDGEISMADASTLAGLVAIDRFRDAAADLQRTAERLFNETQTRLRPEINAVNDVAGEPTNPSAPRPQRAEGEDSANEMFASSILNAVDRVSHILQTWDRFYAEFGVYALAQLSPLEDQMRQFITYQEFEVLIENSLSPMAQGDSIKVLLLKPFDRIRDLLDANHFDTRIAQVLGEKHP